ncbi:hypothetical protein H4217_001733 [Coemansia sp. RSA 1939]|nr:hypothetical protein H4217_001733 [Coemansia sp. RSA 1939]KAJ2607463.1 hypothetical protein EV177_005506 [Coemansia sp. RSA 1804]KAJ2675035.1 hypothetical protein GGH99_005943 [Coemansia sp. RSA 1285]
MKEKDQAPPNDADIEEIVISDDELIDPDSILGGGGGEAAKYSLRPSRTTGQRNADSKSEAKREMRSVPAYRNTLKSLVRASAQKKYDLGFLDAHVESQRAEMRDSGSDSDSDNNGDGGDMDNDELSQGSGAGVAAMGVLQQIKKTRLVGIDGDPRRSPIRFSVFHQQKQVSLLDEDFRLDSTVYDMSDPIDRICSAHRGDVRFFGRLIESRWMQTLACRGWMLTQGVGDILLHTTCFGANEQVADSALQSLCLFLEQQRCSWQVDVDAMDRIVGQIQGKRRVRVVSFESDNEMTLAAGSGVYVEIERESPRGHLRQPQRPSNAGNTPERAVSCLLKAGAMALSGQAATVSAEDTCRLVCLYVDCVLEHSSSPHVVPMQRSLGSVIDRIAPASKWTVVWTECVARIGRKLSHLPLRALLRVVECMPVSSRRCMQVRRSLAFLFLRQHSSDLAMSSEASGSSSTHVHSRLANEAMIPSQIMVRIVGEMVVDSSEEQLFRIDDKSPAGFARIEAAVGLLGHVLDNAQALHDVKDEAREIYRRLGQINRRISDGVANRIDKTLAKDAIQILLVRLAMTAISDPRDRVDMMYNGTDSADSGRRIATTLDRYRG